MKSECVLRNSKLLVVLLIKSPGSVSSSVSTKLSLSKSFIKFRFGPLAPLLLKFCELNTNDWVVFAELALALRLFNSSDVHTLLLPLLMALFI